jgi:hypothetical protein
MNGLGTCSAAVMLAATAAVSAAQVSKTLQGEVHTVTVSVEAIEQSRREVTVKKPDGTYDVFYMPSSIKRFDTLKVGDKITARYYETIVLRLKAPGEKDNNTATGGVVRSPNQPSGTASQQQTVTVTITAIDPKLPSITFTGPRGWTYSSRVEDTKALGQVKVGDRVDITWTEALVMSVEDSK